MSPLWSHRAFCSDGGLPVPGVDGEVETFEDGDRLDVRAAIFSAVVVDGKGSTCGHDGVVLAPQSSGVASR